MVRSCIRQGSRRIWRLDQWRGIWWSCGGRVRLRSTLQLLMQDRCTKLERQPVLNPLFFKDSLHVQECSVQTPYALQLSQSRMHSISLEAGCHYCKTLRNLPYHRPCVRPSMAIFSTIIHCYQVPALRIGQYWSNCILST